MTKFLRVVGHVTILFSVRSVRAQQDECNSCVNQGCTFCTTRYRYQYIDVKNVCDCEPTNSSSSFLGACSEHDYLLDKALNSTIECSSLDDFAYDDDFRSPTASPDFYTGSWSPTTDYPTYEEGEDEMQFEPVGVAVVVVVFVAAIYGGTVFWAARKDPEDLDGNTTAETTRAGSTIRTVTATPIGADDHGVRTSDVFQPAMERAGNDSTSPPLAYAAVVPTGSAERTSNGVRQAVASTAIASAPPTIYDVNICTSTTSTNM